MCWLDLAANRCVLSRVLITLSDCALRMSWVGVFQTAATNMLKAQKSVVELLIFISLSWSDADDQSVMAGTSFSIIEDSYNGMLFAQALCVITANSYVVLSPIGSQ